MLQLLKISDDEHNPMWRLCAGAMAGITSVTVTYPLDLVRYLGYLQNYYYPNMVITGQDYQFKPKELTESTS